MAADLAGTIPSLATGLGLLSIMFQALAFISAGCENGIAAAPVSPQPAVMQKNSPAINAPVKNAPIKNAPIKNAAVKNPAVKNAPPTSASATNENNDRFTLADGATFEFLGVCESPSAGKTWWRPDGTPLSWPPVDAGFDRRNMPPRPKAVEREFTIAAHIPEGAELSSGFFTRETAAGLSAAWNGSGWRRVINYFTSLRDARPVSIVLKYAAGDWKTVATCPANGGIVRQTPHGDILFSHPVLEKYTVSLSVAYVGDDAEVRLVAVDQDSHERLSRLKSWPDVWGSLRPDPIHTLESEFNLALARIKEFRWQSRPLRRVEFRDISMKRGEKSNFGFFVDGRPHEPDRRRQK